MPHANHRLSLFLVPVDPDQVLGSTTQERIEHVLREKRVLDEGYLAGGEANWLLEGGFYRYRFDQPGVPVVYGNRQGGYRVSCPSCGSSLALEVGVVLERWRTGEGRGHLCSKCHHSSTLEEWRFQPPAWPGKCALVFSRVGGLELNQHAAEALEEAAGTRLVPVLSRG